jgi:hypothetical protein
MIIGDASSCGITYACHSDDSRGVIYNQNIFNTQATGLVEKMFIETSRRKVQIVITRSAVKKIK